MSHEHEIRSCPTCGSSLARQEVEGSRLASLVCPKQHRFYIQPNLEPSVADAPAGIHQATAAELIRTPRYCSFLGEQVCTILRRIEEIGCGLHVPHESYDKVFRFCPMCGIALRGCQAWDDWCVGMCCTNGHRFDHRSGLHFIEPAGPCLLEEMSDEDVLFMSNRYVEARDSTSLRLPQAAMQAMEEFVRASDTGHVR